MKDWLDAATARMINGACLKLMGLTPKWYHQVCGFKLLMQPRPSVSVNSNVVIIIREGNLSMKWRVNLHIRSCAHVVDLFDKQVCKVL